MKFIPPLEIASKIMTLIDDAEKNLIIVSPYVEMTNWEKMKKCLSKSINKGIDLKFIIRKNVKNNDLLSLRQLNIQPILIKDLHAKVYINETYAIVTSLNITHYSDINSIDIAYQTENEAERIELIDYVNKYISSIKTVDEKVKPLELKTKHSVLDFSNFINLDRQSTREDIELSEFKVDELHHIFSSNFSYSTIKKTSTYLFCGDLLPFCDVMIHCRYIIKIKKSRPDCEMILKNINEINFNLFYEYDIELLTSHSSFYYLEFVPKGKFEISKLVNDYINITDNILRSDFIKVLKVRDKNRVWS
jgi:hypothetical protein